MSQSVNIPQTAKGHSGLLKAVVWTLYAVFVLITFGLGFYILPAMIAWSRQHKSQAGIWILTFFLGWTGIGWVIALIWSASSGSQQNIIIVQQQSN